MLWSDVLKVNGCSIECNIEKQLSLLTNCIKYDG